MEYTKICFKCGKNLPLSEFYIHPAMGDGHLGKCKTCTKEDSKKREKRLRKNPGWVNSEKKRSREKYHRLNYKTIYKPLPEYKKETMIKYNEKYPEKKYSKMKSGHLKSEKGFHKHHWSYRPEHSTDVIILSISEHSKVHRYMNYDQERMMYRDFNGILLDSKESSLFFYNSLKGLD